MWFKKYWKDLIKGVLALLTITFAVLGWHFSDAANTSFWSHTWIVLAIISLVVWIVVWVILWTSKRNK